MKVYQLVDKETNRRVISAHYSLENAEQALIDNEKEDKENGDYVSNFYQIIEVE